MQYEEMMKAVSASSGKLCQVLNVHWHAEQYCSIM